MVNRISGSVSLGRWAPVWLLLVAMLVVLWGIGQLLARPVGRWADGLRPAVTPTSAAAVVVGEVGGQGVVTPTVRAVPPLRESLDNLKMVDELRGWGHGNGTVWRTEDGGVNWRHVTPPEFDFMLVSTTRWTSPFFLDDQAAWFLEADLTLEQSSRLYRTEDAGRSWSVRTTPFGMARMFFLDEAHGWALASNRDEGSLDVYMTRDGGEGWASIHHMPSGDLPLAESLPISVSLSAPVFRNLTDGWIGGLSSVPGDRPPLYETRDGGQTWRYVDLGLNRLYPDYNYYILPPRFFGEGALQGVLAVYTSRDSLPPVWQWVFFFTDDGGRQWRASQPVRVKSGRGTVQVVSPREVYVLDGDNLFSSTDAAVNWREVETNLRSAQVTSGYRVEFKHFYFVNALSGWVWGADAGGGARLFRTQDGGERWQVVLMKQAVE